MESWLYLGDAQREEFQAFECGCKWQASKNVHVSCLATQGSKEDRRVSKNQTPKIILIQRSRKMSWVHVFTVSQVQLFKKCVCVFTLFSFFQRCRCCHAARSGYVMCHTGSRQAVFNLYCGTDKWVMTLELFLLGDRSRNRWRARETKRDREKFCVCVCFIFFPLKEHLWFRSRGEWGGNSYHLHLWKRK